MLPTTLDVASGASRGARLGNAGRNFFYGIGVGGQSESALSDAQSISEQQNLADGRVVVRQCSPVTLVSV